MPRKATPSAGLLAFQTKKVAVDGEGFHKVAIYHAHGCEECSRRYTDSCKTPHVNGRCSSCRTGSPRARWDADHDPKTCCRTDSKLMTDKADLVKYNLGGPGPWYRCKTCSRQHPYNPGTGATP